MKWFIVQVVRRPIYAHGYCLALNRCVKIKPGFLPFDMLVREGSYAGNLTCLLRALVAAAALFFAGRCIEKVFAMLLRLWLLELTPLPS